MNRESARHLDQIDPGAWRALDELASVADSATAQLKARQNWMTTYHGTLRRNGRHRDGNVDVVAVDLGDGSRTTGSASSGHRRDDLHSCDPTAWAYQEDVRTHGREMASSGARR